MINDKSSELDRILRDLRSFVIAFSGGVDSSFLLFRAKSLETVNVVAVTIRTPYIPSREISEALAFVKTHGIDHHILDLEFPDTISHNPSDRCYFCKKILFTELVNYAGQHGIRYIADGTNADDSAETRPGLRANRELGIRSPLAEAGLTKDEIRVLSKEAGLPLWNKPAMACLLTRIPYNTEVKGEMLGMIDKAENILMEYGYPGARVRLHGDVARIECMPGFVDRILKDTRKQQIVASLKNIGFRYITLDMEGYRTGSMEPENNKK